MVVASGSGSEAPNQPVYKLGPGIVSSPAGVAIKSTNLAPTESDCDPRSPDIDYFTIPIAGFPLADVLLQLNVGRKFFFVASINAANDGAFVFLHFVKQGKTTTARSGSEQWIRFVQGASGGTGSVMGSQIVLCTPVKDNVFVTILSGGGAGTITIGATNDLELISVS
jgi:hypothetical protein